MTKKHSTKRSLIASILVLCLCLTSFIGTTFAWFTDSVTSANNIIKSGKLDVEMYWADGKADPNADATAYTDASTGPIFNYDKWEPGYTEARHIKIANEGTLALKYAIKIIPDGEFSKLADVIDVYYADPAVKADRTLAGLTKLGTLTEVIGDMASTATGSLKADENHLITLVLKMQESAGNEYQDMSIGTTFSVQLIATQETYEDDSFDDLYDDDAKFPELNYATKEENESAAIGSDDVMISIPANAPAGNYEIAVSNKTETTDGAGNTTVAMDITLKKDGEKVTSDGAIVYTVSVEIGKGYTNLSATHNGKAISDFEYDPITGIFSFETADFSPFTFTYKDIPASVGEGEEAAGVIAFILASDKSITYYADLQGAIDAANGGDTIVLLDNVNGAFSFTKEGNFTLNLGGNKITATGIDAISVTGAKTVLTVKNGTLESDGENCGGIYVKNATVVLEDCILVGTNAVDSCGVYASNDSKITINNCEISGKKYGVIMMSADVVINSAKIDAPTSVSSNGSDAYDKANLTINDGTFNGHVYWPAQGKLTINGGKFTDETAIYVKSGSLEINGGTFTGNGEKTDYEYKDSGSKSTGSAIVLENVGESEYQAIGSVSITGGTFISENNMPIESVTKGIDGVNAKTGFVSGGKFSSALNKSLIAIGYEQNVDGEYVTVTALAPLYVDDASDLANAIPGQTIYIQSDITLTEEVTLPADVTLNGNGKQINGTIYAGGNLTIAGHTKVTAFSASYYNRVITIGPDACLEITGSGRVSLAYGNTFNITGTIENAKTADKSSIQPSLIIPAGISITGGSDATFNVTNAYVVIGSTSSKNSSANGTFDFNFTNSIAEFTNQFTLAEPTSGKNPTFNITIKDSVFTTGTKFVIAAPNSNVVIDNSEVTLATYFRNSGNVTLKNGSVLTGATIQFGENGGNDGTTIVDISTLNITATSAGHALDGKGTGKIVAKNGATVSVDYYKGITIECDTTSKVAGTEVK